MLWAAPLWKLRGDQDLSGANHRSFLHLHLRLATLHRRPPDNMADSETPKGPPPGYDEAAAEPNTGGRPAPPPGLRRGPAPLDIPIIKHLNSKRVILASASPRRKALLQQVSTW